MTAADLAATLGKLFDEHLGPRATHPVSGDRTLHSWEHGQIEAWIRVEAEVTVSAEICGEVFVEWHNPDPVIVVNTLAALGILPARLNSLFGEAQLAGAVEAVRDLPDGTYAAVVEAGKRAYPGGEPA